MAGSFVAAACPSLIQTPVGLATYGARCVHADTVFSCPGFLETRHPSAFQICNAADHLSRGESRARRLKLLSSSRLASLGYRHASLRRMTVRAVGNMADEGKDDRGEEDGESWLNRQSDEGKKRPSVNRTSDEADLDRWSGEESPAGTDEDTAGMSDASRGSEVVAGATGQGSGLADNEDAQTKRVLDILHKRGVEASQTSARSLRERFGGFRVSGPQVPMTLQPQNPIRPKRVAAEKTEESTEQSVEESVSVAAEKPGESSEQAAEVEESVTSVQEEQGSTGVSGDLTLETEASSAEDRLPVVEDTVESVPPAERMVGSSEGESSEPVGSSKAESSIAAESAIEAESSGEADSSGSETEESEGEEEVKKTSLTDEEKAINQAVLPWEVIEDIPIPPRTAEDERLRAAFEETLFSDWKVDGLEGELQLYVTKVKALEEFEKEIARPDDDIDLVRTSALIAQHAYPDCTPEECESQLRILAEELKDSLPPPAERYPLRMIKAINKFLFQEQGFKGSWGSDRDMYSPKLLCLNKVLANKTGMPILMSVVYLELARRVGFPMVGVNLPLHFVIRPMDHTCEFLVDPHDGGKLMFIEDIRDKLASVFNAKVVVSPTFVKNTPAVSKRTILVRILNNLKRRYFSNRNYSECLATIEYLKRVKPAAELAPELRDAGLCLFALRRTKEATANLDAYLEAAPDAIDAEAMRDLVQKIREGRL